MKNIVKLVYILVLFILILPVTKAYEYNTLNDKELSCSVSVDTQIYLTEDNETKFVANEYWTTEEKYISIKSEVSVWTSDDNLLSWCTDVNKWTRYSTLSPWASEKVMSLWSDYCTFSKPTDITKNQVQFVFNIATYDITPWSGEAISDYTLAYHNDVEDVENSTATYKNYTNVWFSNLSIDDNSCVNAEIRFCWDTFLDTSFWETCDDGNNIDWDGCSAICQTEWWWPWPDTPENPEDPTWGGWPDTPEDPEDPSKWGDSTPSGDPTPDPTDPSAWDTTPTSWELEFWPTDYVIIWEWMNPYEAHSLWEPYVRNNSSLEIEADKLCVVKKEWTTIVWEDICIDIPGGVLIPWERVSFWYLPNFVGGEVGAWSYEENRLITTIKVWWVLFDDAYFASPLKIRVAKPSVATTGGWTSYVSDTQKLSNVEEVADGILDTSKNKNFVWAWVSTWSVSSYSKVVTDTEKVEEIKNEWDNYSDKTKEIIKVNWTTLWSTALLSDFENYNWIENVFILKNKNFIVNNSSLSGLSWARTYIIENWNLTINVDISYNDNIAFVVKWWDIEIDKNVTSIEWTYVSIIKDSVWGKFMWKWWKTLNILTINGSLYGDISNLVSNRTYVKNNPYDQIDLWTIVSFGSSLFRKPAPLLSNFIDEYLESQRVAK